MDTLRRLLLGLCAAALPLGAMARPPAAGSVRGTVTEVSDGNRLTLTPAGGPPVAVRLRDIDAPELCQTWGEEARRALAELALNKPATLQASGRDAQGRTVGRVWVDEVDLGRRMVEDGQAWSLRTRFDQGPLVKQERMAHALGRGLHGVAGAVLPREFRRTHGPCPAPAAAPPR
jgi:endonuclease YncB( thermonuclease family)